MTQQNMDTGSDVISELLDVNKLRYQMQSDLSVCTSRRFAKQFPTSSSYGSGNRNAVIILQTGSHAVGECYLHGQVTINPGNTVPASDVSIVQATDLILNAVCYSRDGTELQRINGVNLLSRQLVAYKSDVSKQAGFNTLFKFQTQAFSAEAGQSKEFCIPMSLILPMFSYTESTALFPPQLSAGMRVELQLASPDEAFKTAGPAASPVTYELSNLYIQTELFSLTDSVNLKLSENAAQHGLEIVVPDYHMASFQTPSDSCSLEIRKAVSRALSVISIPRETSVLSTTDSLAASSPLPFSTIQTRIGSIYLPNSELNSKNEMYLHTLKSFSHNFPNSSSTDVSLSDYKASGIFCQSLERSNLQDMMSGISTNSSRSLMVSSKFNSAVSTRQVTCYLKYVACIRSFQNNTVKEI